MRGALTRPEAMVLVGLLGLPATTLVAFPLEWFGLDSWARFAFYACLALAGAGLGWSLLVRLRRLVTGPRRLQALPGILFLVAALLWPVFSGVTARAYGAVTALAAWSLDRWLRWRAGLLGARRNATGSRPGCGRPGCGFLLSLVLLFWFLSVLRTMGGLFLGMGFLLVPVVFLMAPLVFSWLRASKDTEERAVFALELAELLEMGVSLPEAVARLKREARRSLRTRSSRLTRALDTTLHEIERGEALSVTLGSVELFPEYWNSLLAQGERLGEVPRVLRQLAALDLSHPRLPHSLAIRVSLMFPVLLLLTGFIRVYLAPTFLKLLSEGGPGPGTGLLLLGELIRTVVGMLLWPPNTVTLVLLAGTYAKEVRDFLWRLPGFWSVARLQEQRNAVGVLQLWVEAGETPAAALQAASQVVSARIYRSALEELSRTGGNLAAALASRPDLFGAELRWLVAQGEQTEQLGPALEAAQSLLARQRDEADRLFMRMLDLVATLALGTGAALTALYAIGLVLRSAMLAFEAAGP